MSQIGNFFIVPILLIALATVYLLSRVIGIEAKPHRYSAIDGLRGYLATFVFLRHASGYYYYVRHHQPGAAPSQLFFHLGSTSVALFFMITAFLFTSKLIESYSKPMDWLKLYVSRVLRIMPLFLFSSFCLFLIVGILSHFSLSESVGSLLNQMGQALFFMHSDINGVRNTWHINLRVQWSLAFEWFFYCTLPAIATIFFRIQTKWVTLLFSGLFLVIFYFIVDSFYNYMGWIRSIPFLSGIAAAFLVRNAKVRELCSGSWFTPFLAVLIIITVMNYASVFELIPFVCISIVFIAIAAGNNFFHILTSKASRLLGQISYSIYLLHPFVLYTVFKFVVPSPEKLSMLGVWEISAACITITAAICCLTYSYIEKPFVDLTPPTTARLRRFFGKPKATNPRSAISPAPRPQQFN